MPPDLDAFEAAFDAAAPVRQPDQAWTRVQRALRRQRAAPGRELVGALLYLAACLGLALAGSGPAWGFAAFAVLVLVPGRWRARRAWRAELAAVESADDVRALCADQALRRSAGVLASALVQGVLALLFLATAGVAALRDRDPRPGLAAGLVLLVWVVVQLLVRLPRVARERAVLERVARDRSAHDGED